MSCYCPCSFRPDRRTVQQRLDLALPGHGKRRAPVRPVRQLPQLLRRADRRRRPAKVVRDGVEQGPHHDGRGMMSDARLPSGGSSFFSEAPYSGGSLFHCSKIDSPINQRRRNISYANMAVPSSRYTTNFIETASVLVQRQRVSYCDKTCLLIVIRHASLI